MSRIVALCRILLGSLMLTAVAVNFANVVGRYVFAKPIFWAEEAMVFLQVWCVFIGAAIITHAGTHLRMDAIESLAPRWIIRVAELVALLLMVAVASLVSFYSAQVVIQLFNNGERSIALQMPMALPYASIPIGFLLILLLALRRLWGGLRRGPRDSEA